MPKKESLSTDPYKGVRDFYPADWARLEAIFTNIRKTLSKCGYEEYNASPLERSEIYETKTSEEIVRDQTYTFMDRGDRSVTLRPEMTPTLARMVAAKRRELPFPLRWFSIGNRFRYERPQRGRTREFYQADIDLIGLPDGEADIEIVRLAATLLKNFGAKETDYVIRMNSRPLLNAACKASGLSGERIKRYLHLLDRKGKITPSAFAAAFAALAPKCDPLALINQQSSEDATVAHEKRALLERIDLLKTRGVSNIIFDPTITRGFDYYTGMVFEVYDTNSANPRALFGGGRYDELVSLFGGESMPAVGFALGDVTLGDFIDTHNLALKTDFGKPQIYIGTPSVSDIPAAQEFADTLREQECRVFVNLAARALGDQIKDAVKRGIPLFTVYGTDEKKTRTLRVKILKTGEEMGLHVSELSAHLRAGS